MSRKKTTTKKVSKKTKTVKKGTKKKVVRKTAKKSTRATTKPRAVAKAVPLTQLDTIAQTLLNVFEKIDSIVWKLEQLVGQGRGVKSPDETWVEDKVITDDPAPVVEDQMGLFDVPGTPVADATGAVAWTKDQITNALQMVSTEKGLPVVKELLTKWGAQRVSDIPESIYGQVVVDIKAKVPTLTL